MSAVIFDTNAYRAFKEGKSEVFAILEQTTQIWMCSIVLGELLAGFAAGSRETQNRRELYQFLKQPQVSQLTVDGTTADFYASIFRSLRSKGRPIPTNDLWIAALALQYNCVLYTYDDHFHYVDNIRAGATSQALFGT